MPWMNWGILRIAREDWGTPLGPPRNSRSWGFTFFCVLLIMVLGLSLAKWGREEAQAQSPDCSIYINVTRWWQLKHFLEFSPRSLGKWSNLTSIFLRWVGSTTNQVTTSNLPTECYCAQLGAVTSAHIFLVKWEVWNSNDVSTAGKSNFGWFLMDLTFSNWIFGENLWICRFGQETSPLF